MTLPTWIKDATGRWTCDDPAELKFAQIARQFAGGFAVPEFDQWIGTLPDDEGKRDLIERRTLAKDTHDKNVMLRHLEFLNSQRQYVRRTDELREPAAVGEKTIKTRKLAANTTNAKVKAKNARRDARIVKRARGLIQANEANPRTVSRRLVDNGQADELGIKAVRDILRKAGVR